MGDVPIYVAPGGADQLPGRSSSAPTRWRACRPTTTPRPASCGATRCTTGTRCAADGYRWWIERFRRTFELFDLVRVDHFRGFSAFWEVPATATRPR